MREAQGERGGGDEAEKGEHKEKKEKGEKVKQEQSRAGKSKTNQ